MPLISFVIPTLEEEKVIGKILKNLREIKSFDYEIIVSDGGSKDKTLEIAKSLADKVVENRPGHRQTIAEGRNQGAAEATGEYIVFMDADVTIFDPDVFFQRALEDFKKVPNLVALGGWIKVLPEMETLGDMFWGNIMSNWSFVLHNNILKIGGNGGEFGMVRADVFKKLGGYDQSLTASEDFEFFSRLAKAGRVLTDTKLVFYHTGRRAHKVGWPRLLFSWWKEYLYVNILHRSHTEEWKVIR